MNCRRHGSRPTLALWMLVAVADVALLAAAAGPLVTVLLVVTLVTVGAAVVGARALARREPVNAEVAKVVMRRRA
jgi:hypothetical protein